MLDYGLEDLFGEEDKPQNNKQLVSKPPAYEDLLKEIAIESGQKQIYINPEYILQPEQLEELPPEYEEDETPDYNIIEEDRINEVLDRINIPNYNSVELQLAEEGMNPNTRKSYPRKIIKDAKYRRSQPPGYSTSVTKKLNSGLISETEAQMKRKVNIDTMNVLNDYIDYHETKLNTIIGSGLKRKTKKGGNIVFFNNPTEILKKLELIIGSIAAGNNSMELRNTGVAILDMLLRNSILNNPQYNKIYNKYFNIT